MNYLFLKSCRKNVKVHIFWFTAYSHQQDFSGLYRLSVQFIDDIDNLINSKKLHCSVSN